LLGEEDRQFLDALGISVPPLAIHFSPEKPEGLRPGEGLFPSYSLITEEGEERESSSLPPCVIPYLRRAHKKRINAYFDLDHFACPSAAYHLGFLEEIPPGIPEYISTGFGEALPGERYAPDPDTARAYYLQLERMEAPREYLVVSPLESLEGEALAILFLVPPDALAGLATAVYHATGNPRDIISPWGSGCASTLAYPIREAMGEGRAVVGVFDPSARPHLSPFTMSLAMPYSLYRRVLETAEDSFLSTPGWRGLRRRIVSKQKRRSKRNSSR